MSGTFNHKDHVKEIFGRDVDLEVLIYRRPNLRDDNLEYERHMGNNVLRGLYDEMVMMPHVRELFLSFPEVWLYLVYRKWYILLHFGINFY